jgi:hypothetical protein
MSLKSAGFVCLNQVRNLVRLESYVTNGEEKFWKERLFFFWCCNLYYKTKGTKTIYWFIPTPIAAQILTMPVHKLIQHPCSYTLISSAQPRFVQNSHIRLWLISIHNCIWSSPFTTCCHRTQNWKIILKPRFLIAWLLLQDEACAL